MWFFQLNFRSSLAVKSEKWYSILALVVEKKNILHFIGSRFITEITTTLNSSCTETYYHFLYCASIYYRTAESLTNSLTEHYQSVSWYLTRHQGIANDDDKKNTDYYMLRTWYRFLLKSLKYHIACERVFELMCDMLFKTRESNNIRFVSYHNLFITYVSQ